MINTKRLAQLVKKWQRIESLWRKRLTMTVTSEGEGCSTAVAGKGHCRVYTADGVRFEVPLVFLGTAVFGELLRMSQEEFGFTGSDGGRITLPCDAMVMEYTMCLLRRNAPVETETALLSTMAMIPCGYDMRSHLGFSQQVPMCSS